MPLQDLRYALRQLARSPGFTTVAVLTLGLGIAGIGILATILSTLFLEPLPVPAPDRLVAVYTADFSHGSYGSSSYPDYVDMAAGMPSLEGLTGFALQPASLSGAGGESRRILLSEVAGDFFGTLRVPMAAGRGFTEDEIRVGGPPAVVLSHSLWQARFGGRADLIGHEIKLGGQPFTVVGVAALAFRGLLRGVSEDAWVPYAADPILQPGSDALTSRGNRGTLLYGRLRPGATVEAARGEAAVVAARLFQDHPDMWRTIRGTGRQIAVLPESQVRVLPMVRGPALGAGALLGVVVFMVLLVACANLANLVMARTAARYREFAVRLALGASRTRLVRQLLIENVVLAAGGGLLGLACAAWIAGGISQFQPPLPIPVSLQVHPDFRVILVVAAVTGLAGCLLGLAPALQISQSGLNPVLKDAGISGARTRSRLRGGFVVLQVAFSLVLLIGAGLFLRSLREALAIDPGFGARRALLLPVDLSLNHYSSERVRQFQQDLADRVRALPGVTDVAIASDLPLSLGGGRRSTTVEGYRESEGEDMEIPWTDVSAGYFEALEVPLAAGRTFGGADRAGAPDVAIVNESFVRRFWPGESGIGRRISLSGPEGSWLEVVGVARDGKYQSLGEDPTPFMYFPIAQRPDQRFTVVARTTADPATLAPPVRQVVRALDASLPLDQISTLEEHIGLSLLPARLAGMVLGLLGMLALVLASLGVAGMVAFGVSQRVREIGLRLALGAQSSDVVRLVVRDALRLVLIGGGVGLALALPLSLLARRFLYGLSPVDPMTWVVVVLGFVAVTAGASWLPARRAAGVDPLVALRAD